MFAISQADRVASISLQERADASTALAMHEMMICADLEHIDSVEVDASMAMKLDASVLQLLVAWFSVLDSRHIPWRWRGVSAPFSLAVEQAGLSQALRLGNGRSDEKLVN